MLSRAGERRRGGGRPLPHYDVSDAGAGWSDKTTKALLHFDDSALDSSLYGRTVMPVGDAAVDSEQKRFGLRSLRLQGSGHVDVMMGPDSLPGTLDVSMEAMVRLDSTATRRVLDWFQDASNQIWLEHDAGIGWKAGFKVAGVSAALMSSGSVATPGVWYHVAATRKAGVWSLRVNGAVVASSAVEWAPGWSFGSTLRVGRDQALSMPGLAGNVDEVRLCVGARVCESMPSAAYGVSELMSGRGRQIMRGDATDNMAYYLGSEIYDGQIFVAQLRNDGYPYLAFVNQDNLVWNYHAPVAGSVNTQSLAPFVMHNGQRLNQRGYGGDLQYDVASGNRYICSYGLPTYGATGYPDGMCRQGRYAYVLYGCRTENSVVVRIPLANFKADALSFQNSAVRRIRAGMNYKDGRHISPGPGCVVVTYNVSARFVKLSSVDLQTSQEVIVTDAPGEVCAFARDFSLGVCDDNYFYTVSVVNSAGNYTGLLIRIPLSSWSASGVQAVNLAAVDSRFVASAPNTVDWSGSVVTDGRHVYVSFPCRDMPSGAVAKVDTLNFTAAGVEVVEIGPSLNNYSRGALWGRLHIDDNFVYAMSLHRVARIPCRAHDSAHYKWTEDAPLPLPAPTIFVAQFKGGTFQDDSLNCVDTSAVGVETHAVGGRHAGKAVLLGATSCLKVDLGISMINSYPIRVSHPYSYSQLGRLTIDFFMRSPLALNDYQQVAHLYSPNNAYNTLRLRGSGLLEWSPVYGPLLTSTDKINPGVWTHVELSHDYWDGVTTPLWRLFVDGKNQTSMPTCPVARLASGETWVCAGATLVKISAQGAVTTLPLPTKFTLLSVTPDGSYAVAARPLSDWPTPDDLAGPSGLYVSRDHGATWLERTSARRTDTRARWLTAVRAIPGGGLIAMARNDYPWLGMSTDYGESFTSLNGPKAYSGNSMACSADMSRIGMAENSSVHMSVDGGASSASVWDPEGVTRAIACSDDGMTWYSHGSKIGRSVNGGSAWTEMPMAGTRDWRAMACSADGSKAVFAAASGRVWLYDLALSDFDEVDGTPDAEWAAVAMSADGSKAAAVTSGFKCYGIDVATGAVDFSVDLRDHAAIGTPGSPLSHPQGTSFVDLIRFGAAEYPAAPGMEFSDIRISTDVLHRSNFTPPAGPHLP